MWVTSVPTHYASIVPGWERYGNPASVAVMCLPFMIPILIWSRG